MTVSVCTLAHGRADHLANLVRGLAQQTVVPTELIVAVMQPDAYALPEAPFPIRQIMLGSQGIPLAAARNTAARAAREDRLVFLDVDCIPTPTLVADYARLLDHGEALLMGEVLYLPAGATGRGIAFDHFAAVAVKHSERAAAPATDFGECSDYRCFWSLNFAMHAATFARIGGFDEGYVGYGGEDTDFGRMVSEAGVPLRWVGGARAYHQYHPHHMPPVHHVDSVIANASRFRDKWGHYTMEHWLKAFTLMGMIGVRDGDYVRLREVDDADLALTGLQSGAPYASTARVLAVLEGATPATAPA